VSRVEASYVDRATAYLSFDCQWSDDLRPYVYVTRDYGKSWTSIVGDLPAFGNVNVVKQDPKNPNLLFAGTEFGLYVSLDEGRSWKRFMTGLSTVRVDEVIVHPRDGDLVVGTHGRSALVMDNITPLQQLAVPGGTSVLATDVHLFRPRAGVLWKRDQRLARTMPGSKVFRGENPAAGTAIDYYLKTAASGPVTITIADATSGKGIRTLRGTAEAGINRVQWDLRGDLPAPGTRPVATDDEEDMPRSGPQGPLAKPGSYKVTLSVNGRSYTQTVAVEQDAWNSPGK
jgi:hypothetical protein